MPISITCRSCGRSFKVPPSRVSEALFCGTQCLKTDTVLRRARPLDHALLLRTLSYDPVTGIFVSLVPERKRRVGDRVGTTGKKGYRWVTVDAKPFQEHRLAWFYMTGEWPSGQIDHRNLNKGDNSWDNLRDANNSKNQRNIAAKRTSQTGIKGVWPVKERFKTQKYKACICYDGRKNYLGHFDTVEEAAAAYAVAAAKHHGEFARTE